MSKDNQSNFTISYIHLRRLIGILGMILPLVCAVGGLIFTKTSLLANISSYYYTNMRDVFVGILVGVSMFLMTYKGYDKRDHYITSSAGFAGLGIAIFPTNMRGEPLVRVGVFYLKSASSNIFHTLSAIIFFGLLAYMSICLFTLSHNGQKQSVNKHRRNRIYIACGVIMIIGIIGLIFTALFIPVDIQIETQIIFFLETMMLEAFGVSWFVKGKTILQG